jgi:eukaryotic-like serine/threonine-protein kinase
LNDSAARLQAALADRYRIERELGRGGMATVYLAHDLRHDRPVALKTLHPELGASLGSDRFLREIKLAARLQHPHILSVHDSGEAAGLLWFTMPYVEGESLRDRLQREHQLPLDDAVRITHEAARALDYAHRHGVVHRDVKPENILLTKDGDTLVADFGIGRALGGSGAEERLTETGIVVGTPAYMSPEQAAGERELDGRTDVYSLGVVLYEMLAGEPPFTGATAQAITARRLTETPRPLRPVRESVPQELDQLVMRALARAPADRPITAAAFAEALDGVRRSGGMATAAPAHRAIPVRRAGVRKKWLAGLLGGVMAAGLLATILRSRAGAPPELDPSLLAVTPFDVLDSKLGLWREGMVDLLSRNLDGAGPLRTVAPTVIVRRWRGRADPESAADLGRRTGAGLALYGSLLSSGRDSVQVRATLFDVRRQSTMDEWELVEVADRVDRLADSLTFRLLRGLGRTRPVGSVRLAGFGSSSLPAVKAFLQGEQHLRRSQWDSALGYYERAIRLDSTFPLALRRASIALGWIRTGFDSLSTAYALQAGAANHGLAPRDSLLLTVDSLMAALFHAGPLGMGADTSWGVQLSRLFATAAQATSRYPDDPEAWFSAGEAHSHFGRYAGRSIEQELHAFDRAIALDSAYAPSYIHPIQVSAAYGPEAMRRYLRPYLALGPKDVNADGLRLVQAILDSGRVVNLAVRFASVPGDGVFAAFLALSHLPDSAEVAIEVARFMASRTWAEPPLSLPDFTRRVLARSLLSRGHLRAGYQVMRVMRDPPLPLLAEAALLGAVPTDTVAAAFRELLSGPAGAPLVMAFPWWAGQRDTASLRTAAARGESLARLPGSSSAQIAAYVARSAGAYLALARGDSVEALERFFTLQDGVCPFCYFDQVTLVQLLVEQRQDRAAWRMLQGELAGGIITAAPSGIIWWLLRGRVAERIGEPERAIESYAWVAGMWRNADPQLQPYVTEAREGLARLTSQRK